MRTTMVIPTYWSRATTDPWQEGDAVYDHPTPLDVEGTLGRTLESMKILNHKDFKLVIPICPTADEIEDQAEERVRGIIEKAGLEIETYVFTQKNLRLIKDILREHGVKEKTISMLNLKGYSNVRNICLYVAHILSSDITILIDDDELFEKPDWVGMAREFIGKRMYGKSVYGVAGYYLNKFDEFYDDVDILPWMTYWNRFGSKTKAFDKIIGCEPRLKITPFAFGGAMVIHKNMYQIVPFDTHVTRGEDIDYLINAKMFGFDFFLDNKLSIKHLPPKKNHPIWKRFREDIYRFLYQQAKISSQYEVNNMNRVVAEDFDPYPGDFLKTDLEDKIYKTNVLLGLEYLSKGDVESCRESIKNIYLSKYEAIPKDDPFTNYRKTQKQWVSIIEGTRDKRMDIRKEMESNNMSRQIREIDTECYKAITVEEIVEKFAKMEDFKKFSDEEIRRIASMAKIEAHREEEFLFKENSANLAFYIVLKGCVRIVKYDDKKEEILLGNVCSGGVIGETFLLKDKYNVTGIASEFVETMVMYKEDLEVLIQEDPELGNKMLYLFLDRLYFKLHRANIQLRETVIQNEQISSMN